MPSSGAQEWLDKADEDERTVGILQVAGGPWSVAAYHVQQAAEKLIKAALVNAGVPPPRSHDLSHLLSLHPLTVEPDVHHAAAMTSAYAWLTRYPRSTCHRAGTC